MYYLLAITAFVATLIAAYFDIISRKVSNRFLYTMLVIYAAEMLCIASCYEMTMFEVVKGCIIKAAELAVLAIFGIVANLKSMRLGGGDIKLLMILALFLAPWHFVYMLLAAGVTALIVLLIYRKKTVPFVPFIAVGTVLGAVLLAIQGHYAILL